MESIIVASNTRLRTRVRNNLVRNTKNRQSFNKNHINNNNNNNNNRNHRMVRSNSLRNNNNHNSQKQHINNVNINKNINENNKVNGYVNDNNGNGNEIEENLICAGEFTREVYKAIGPRLGHTLHIPEDSVQAIFNEMHLYPSKSQVSEMLHCARQCGGRNGASKYITFGELCVFVREMQNQNPKNNKRNSLCNSNNKCVKNCEVFLGGSCNPTTWRADTAIPELQKHGITFYNPQVAIWAPELIAIEHDAKQSASVLLFVVDSQTRSIGGMIEVAYLVASGRCVVLVAQPYKPGQNILDETITQREYLDLVEGQNAVLTLVKSRGIKVHTNLTGALQYTANLLRNSSNNGITTEEQVTNKLRKLREVFDSYGGQNDEISFLNMLDAFQKLTHRQLKLNELFEYLKSSKNENDANMNAGITFERFCMLMAEFTTDHCDTCTPTDGRFSHPLYWTCALLKSRHLLNFYLLQPLTNALVWASQPFQRQYSSNNNSSITKQNDYIEDNNKTIINKQQFDVFLGGTLLTKTNWRCNTAIPLLKKHGITYYNPAMREEITTNNYYELDNNINNIYYDNNDIKNYNLLEIKQIMDKSKILLLVIPNDRRSLTTMILAAYYMGLGRDIVLCIQYLPEDVVIGNEKLSKQAVKDYNRGRSYLADYAKRKQIPVFENITEAVEVTINKFCHNR